MTSTQNRPALNGVDVPMLFATLDTVRAQPAAAQFQFRAKNRVDQRHAQPLVHPGLLRRRHGGRHPHHAVRV